MSLNAHLSELRRKHETLSRQVEEAARQPSMDSMAVTEMKKKKLAIKQQIERLKTTATH